MKIKVTMAFVLMLIGISMNSQKTSITGRFADAFTEVPLPQVKVSIEGQFLEVYSESSGDFRLDLDDFISEDVILRIEKPGYILKRIPIHIETGQEKDLLVILLEPDLAFEQTHQNTISLSEAELLSEDSEFDNISGVLQSSRDVFQNAAAFDFSQTFFRPRGLSSDYGKILINGIEMNSFYDGKPQWSMWGGLNDVQRNQVFSVGLSSNDYQFGGIGGTTNIIMRASKYQRGGRISIAGSNRSYKGRLMATYASGEEDHNWFYAVSVGRRYADEAYIDGSVYDANSIFIAVEKLISNEHSLNFSAFYTPNFRGKSAPLTQEVFNLKGRTYNPYWGAQDGKIRNSRLREIRMPVFMLNHNWELSKALNLNTNLGFQFGEISNSRIDYGGTSLETVNGQSFYQGGGANPDPVYYQKLPSYFLRFEDNRNYEAAFLAQTDISQNGQIDWEKLYASNLIAKTSGLNSVYILAKDVNKERQISVNSILDWKLNNNMTVNSAVKYTQLQNQNFARVGDLLGGEKFLDIDVFALELGETPGVAVQNDLRNFNRLVEVDDSFKYNYEILAKEAEVFSQLLWTRRSWETYLAANLEWVSYQRNGLYQNGIFAENSWGKSKPAEFLNLGFKIGGIYKFSGKHNLEVNLGYLEKAPGIRNSFINPRQNNLLVTDLQSEKISTADISYRYRSPAINFRVSTYCTVINDATEVSYYFSDGLSGLEQGNTAAFVQEVLADIDKKYYGFELGAFSQVTPTIRVKAALGLGQYIYSNNPDLSLTSANFETKLNYEKAFLKNYHLPGGPQTAGQIGFEYRDPQFWWFGTTLNYFSRSFIDINPLSRTKNFRLDSDGLPLLDFDENAARELLKQEEFQDYFLVNLIGGKSWRIKDKYLGTFVSLNNIFNTLYKSGGFEQARNSNYRNLKLDLDRDLPLFGPKYWFGAGSSFFANLSLRF
ncbi:TonB-dependent receptor [Christiangramia salexigens]|uniref:TonB-dependent receptor n=1 Tax=Christiangramia salexigens TaxID=1913577 RepID=A0A1L3J720_9FLAO|nr:TonB-dependent receptor [Christiangramia salexigens]APG60918.1 TonB-dependent receptor [Christiangramia salexigens]